MQGLGPADARPSRRHEGDGLKGYFNSNLGGTLVCKHIGALKALGLIPGRKARPSAARRAHARRLAEESAPADPPAEIPAPARPAGSFAAGIRSAVASEVRRISGAPEPEAEIDGHLCVWCGQPFEPEISRDPHLCAHCNEYGNAQGGDL